MKSFKLILEEAGDYPKTVAAVHKNLSQHYHFLDKHHENHEEHREAINNYTDDSTDLNEHLWETHKGARMKGGPAYSELDKETKHMDAALNHHKTPHPITVYSGTKMDPTLHADPVSGIVNHPAYLSTSLDKNIAKGFARSHADSSDNHILKIDIPKGHKGAYVAHIGGMSKEKEFILPRGLNMRIKSTSKRSEINKITKRKETYHIHHMSIVD